MNDYEEWYEEHKEECTKNHEGSSGSMEVESVKEMFVRSGEKFGVKYSDYIGDGDSKTFKAILNVNPYGDELTVKKVSVLVTCRNVWARVFVTPKSSISSVEEEKAHSRRL